MHYSCDNLIKPREWKNKTFEECVLDIKDQECQIADGSIRDFSIVTKCNIGIDPEKSYLESQFSALLLRPRSGMYKAQLSMGA